MEITQQTIRAAVANMVFVDCETTGLDYEKHRPFEIAYGTLRWNGEQFIDNISVYYPGLTMQEINDADPEALEVNGETYDSLKDKYWGKPAGGSEHFIETLSGATLVGANVRFDARMIEQHVLGREIWKHRLFDIQAFAAGVLGLGYIPGMREIADIVRNMGYMVPEPDHTAEVDTAAVMYSYLGLMDYRSKLHFNGTLLSESIN